MGLSDNCFGWTQGRIGHGRIWRDWRSGQPRAGRNGREGGGDRERRGVGGGLRPGAQRQGYDSYATAFDVIPYTTPSAGGPGGEPLGRLDTL